ncbi:MAG TPA: glycosyltransferase family 39 protein [Kiritimatiellia bacterium]|nr:glycosyltransferase family 39 protein [Kiritimatiellia bacterium]HMP35226.1 glycosyltransferase family 39 protein [Kiritimatiellia bacterium]
MAKSARKPAAPSAVSSTSAPLSIPRPDSRWVWGLLLVAALIRLPFLGRSDLWVDELLFMWDSNITMSPWQVWSHHYQKFPAIGHLPLGAMFHNALLHLTGQSPETIVYSPLLQRLPAVIWGILSVPLFYLAARRLAGELTGRVAGALFAVGFFPVFYAREAYYYAPLIFFSIASLYGYARWTEEGPRWRPTLLWLGAMAATTLCHISGVMLPLAFALVGLIGLVIARRSPDTAPKAPGLAIALPVLSTLPLIPFLLIRMANPGQQGVSGAPSWWMILYDMIGKLFAGVSPVAFAVAVIVLLAGIVAVVRAGGSLRRVGWVTVALVLMILIGALKTQYSARYFSVAAPGMYLFFAAGFGAIAHVIGRGVASRTAVVTWVLVVLFAAAHLVFFHGVAYQLEAKARNYGGMARWINQQVPEGGGYLIESAYDVRFLGQYHRTPDRTPMTPFFHSTAEDVARLRAIQQEIMVANPDIPFVEASRHGTEFNPSVPVWTWPHSYFRQRADLWNRPLQTLVARGIWPQIHAAGMPDIEYHTTIWFNEPGDMPSVVAAQGGRSWASFDGAWRMAQVAQGVYMRVHPPSRAAIALSPVGDAPVTGDVVVRGSVASADPEVAVRLEQGGQVVTNGRWSTSRLNELLAAGITIAPGGPPLELVTDPQKQGRIQALMVERVRTP